MNRRTKIIVSVAGIFIVLLALLGITYAYFLTKINGNSNTKSISVTTANLELTYGDNSSEILGSGKVLQPSNEPIGTKEFTVTNNGETTSYSVVIEDVIVKKENTNTTFFSNDFRYKLTCTSTNGSCDGTTEEKVFPLNGGVIIINDIPKSTTHTYTLTMYYKETGKNQSEDMGKTLSAKININQLNPFNTNTLAYHIINNSKENKNGTNLVNATVNTRKNNELSMTLDNYGTSYYYRGRVSDNYLEFNNMCWRIVRIEGDGSIKITLAKEDLCSSITSSDTNSALINNGENVVFGYTLENGNYLYNYENYSGGLYTKLNEWYNAKIKSKESYLKNDTWCLGGSTTDEYPWIINGETDYNWYDSKAALRVDLGEEPLNNICLYGWDTVNNYVGAITAEEVALSGAVVTSGGSYNYFGDNVEPESLFWTLTRAGFAKNTGFNQNDVISKEASYSVWGGTLDYSTLVDSDYLYSSEDYTIAARPAITLKSESILKSGDGTLNNPYKVVES